MNSSTLARPNANASRSPRVCRASNFTPLATLRNSLHDNLHLPRIMQVLDIFMAPLPDNESASDINSTPDSATQPAIEAMADTVSLPDTQPSQRETPPREKVFSTTEVLEQIMLSLPPIDMLVSQRVSRTFRNTFTGSKKLQAVVRPPAPEPDEDWICQYDHDKLSYRFDRQATLPGPFSINGPKQIKGVVPNTTLFNGGKFANCIGYKRDGYQGGYFVFDFSKVTSESPCLNHRLAEPPLKEVNHVRSDKPEFSVGCFVQNPTGVTVGDMFAICGPSPRVCVDIGYVKCMEEEYMQRMRTRGYYTDLFHAALSPWTGMGHLITHYLNDEDIKCLASVNLKMLCRLSPKVANKVFPIKY